ncbi:alpha/beta hydrolase [Phytomonospora sp. NPDC050363]|uniref:alpha/beta hydrolase n=1 Tax=Phytomonospora sp. NPDC050363 TaxID=3155642 RepID=UPI0033EDFA7F
MTRSQALDKAFTLFRDSAPDPETATVSALREADARLWASFPVGAADIVPVDAGGVPALRVTAPGAETGPVVVWFHGGGYQLGAADGRRAFAADLSAASKATVLVPDFRLAPEHPFPAAVEDAVAVYEWALSRHDPASVSLGGESAGGGLAVVALLAARDRGLPQPAAAIPVSVWTDLALTGASYRGNAGHEPVATMTVYEQIRDAYLAGHDPRDPLASPLYADLTGLPPLLVMVGAVETLLDDSTALARRAEEAGVAVDLRVWPDMIHYWHLFGSFLPEGRRAVEAIAAFVRRHTA